ncbi:MAG: sodium:proton antiporter [Alphaproteobacteria bacterium]|nr:sodium:proton antiporter [Alphaproteobacteria bacterium]
MLLDIISGVLLAAGSFFIIVGAIGLVRLPDMFARMHGAGVTDTLGAGLFIAGLMIQGGFTLITVKLFMILVFFFFASPTSSYALANAALSQGEKPWTRESDNTNDNKEDSSSKT